MKYPAARVRCLAGKDESTAFSIELSSPLDKFLYISLAVFDHDVDGTLVAKPRAGIQSVLFVKGDLVLFGERNGNTTLSVLSVGFAGAVFRQDSYARPGPRDLDSRAKPGYTASYNDEVSFEGQRSFSSCHLTVLICHLGVAI
jgi:hypothetical protein